MNRSHRTCTCRSSPPWSPRRWSLRAAAPSFGARRRVGGSRSAPGITKHPDPHREPPASDRAGRTRLQRDRPGLQRVLPVRQRARRRLRAQDQVHVSRRRVRPVQDGLGGPPARAAGQRLRDLRRPGHAHPPGRGQVPQLSKVPDVFVASGCDCWNNPTAYPYTLRLAARLRPRGQDPRRVRQAAFPGQEDRLLLPERRVRPGRRQGPQTTRSRPRRWWPGRATCRTNVNIGPAVAALKASGAQVVVSFAIPAFNALFKLTSLKLSFNPSSRGQQCGHGPDHPRRPAANF